MSQVPSPPSLSPPSPSDRARPARNARQPRAGGPTGRRAPGDTRRALLDAARAEFDESGYEGTDTNRIARRAGFAPQTFYRHFRDKTEVFVECYHRWLADEWKDLEKAHGQGADKAARILLRHHSRHRVFRRSLRHLTTADPAVRSARAESRRRQLDLLEREDTDAGRRRSRSVRLALLLSIERIADAAAEGELSDLGLKSTEQVAMLADVLRRFATNEGRT